MFAYLVDHNFRNFLNTKGLVPDFRLKTANSTDATRYQLAELKIISCCDAWYAPSAGGNTRSVEKRSNGLPADYRRKARNADKESREIKGDARGPVEQKLEEYGDLLGLVFGAWGEASEGIHSLIQTLSLPRLNSLLRPRGKAASNQELAHITSQIRRRLSQVVIKSQVDCRLSRLHQIGSGSRGMIKRREWALREEDMMKKERQVQWLRKSEGVVTLHKGHIKTI